MTAWRKSSHSADNTPDCVELARLADRVGVRDSKQPDQGHLTVAVAAYATLIQRIKSGELDR